MVAALNERKTPFGLVLTGEAKSWQGALDKIVGPQWLCTYRVSGRAQLIEAVEAGLADAALLDDSAEMGGDALQVLRIVRRINRTLPVVLVTERSDRRWLEDALRLTAFSVVTRPLELEELLRQIWRLMVRLDAMMRMSPQD